MLFLLFTVVCLEVCITPDGISQKYECAWAPFSSPNELRDPMNLIKSPITYSNMVIHELKEGASMGFFLSTVDSMPSTKALLLVNTDNTCAVDKKFYPASDVSLPTLVVTKEVGTFLSRLIDDKPRNVSVKIIPLESNVAEEAEVEMALHPKRELCLYVHVYKTKTFPLNVEGYS